MALVKWSVGCMVMLGYGRVNFRGVELRWSGVWSGNAVVGYSLVPKGKAMVE